MNGDVGMDYEENRGSKELPYIITIKETSTIMHNLLPLPITN